MHTATQFELRDFCIEVAGAPAQNDDLFPGWHKADRFGIVVTEALGGLGASLLIQLAVTNFYETDPARRSLENGEYPDVYLFHFNGRHGDFSSFDFWPPRKEVVVSSREPIALLEALNSHGVTRLALPDGPGGDIERLRRGPSTWAEERSASGRLATCLAYHSDGQTERADVVISTAHPSGGANTSSTLNLVRVVQEMLRLPQSDFVAALPGPSIPDDIHRWGEVVDLRAREVPQTRRDEIWAGRSASVAERGGVCTESYRRLTVAESLRRIAGL
ncbi:hypothetical protein JCM18899A_07900 [Nocardioides sp. AN3]